MGRVGLLDQRYGGRQLHRRVTETMGRRLLLCFYGKKHTGMYTLVMIPGTVVQRTEHFVLPLNLDVVVVFISYSCP